MTISIGRFGRDITPVVLSAVDQRGRDLHLRGLLRASSLANAKVLRQQLAGLVDNPDEPVVPLVSTADPSLNGYYRVASASIGANNDRLDYENFHFPWEATVERVGAGYNPLLERTLIGALRTNSHSITLASVVAYFGTPLYATLGAETVFGQDLVSGVDGSTIFHYKTNPAATPYVGTWSVNPDDVWGAAASYYSNAALLESKWADGSTYRAVVGRQVPARVAASVRPGQDWRLSNGLVRVAPANTTGGSTDSPSLKVEVWDGSQWDTAVKFDFDFNGSPYPGPFTQFTVLRNDAAAVSIRCAIADSPSIALVLDLTLRRGAKFVTGRWALSTAMTVKVKRSATEAATALTGGIRATSNDASGNRYVLSSPQATTNDLTNGSIASSSTVTAYDFMIGLERGGSGASSQATAQNMIYQYMCAQSESYRIVGR